MTLKIIAPDNNQPERQYVIDYVFNFSFGIPNELTFQNTDSYTIQLPNGNSLRIKDQFFNLFPEPLSYLNAKNIPQKIETLTTHFTDESDLPVIFGQGELQISQTDQSKNITLYSDLFAGIFFMLTRWEEAVVKQTDSHNRFLYSASLAYKAGFLERPVVDQTLELLWNLLKFLDCKSKPKEKNYSYLITHDIDHAFKYTSLTSGLREIIGDIIKRKNLKKAARNALNKLAFHLRIKPDPFDLYDFLMDVSEKFNTKSHFFLHSVDKKQVKYDNQNDKYIKYIAQKVKNRGHLLGYHPSYLTYNNPELFHAEKLRIEKIVQTDLKFGRQHYLRFEIPTTWQIWEDEQMLWDSTLAYPQKEGFRTGTCSPFHPFNIHTRKKLNLLERPLTAMDATFFGYQKLDETQTFDKIKTLHQTVKKYNGQFVLLWHNSFFESNPKRFELYQQIVKLLNS